VIHLSDAGTQELQAQNLPGSECGGFPLMVN